MTQIHRRGCQDAGRAAMIAFVRKHVHAVGRGQAVRHRVLVPTCAGSNPAVPAILIKEIDLKTISFIVFKFIENYKLVMILYKVFICF